MRFERERRELRLANRPKLVIVLLVAMFAVLLGVALYAPAYIASYSSKTSSGLSITPVSYLHPTKVSAALADNIPQANYTGVLYVQHVCVYHE